MALYRNDYEFLDNQITSFKMSLFQLVSNFGPYYQANFMISFNQIRSYTGRERLTTVMLNDYQNYLEGHGFSVQFGIDSLLLSTSAPHIVTVGNESIELSNALALFRKRALLNGDVDNM